MLKKILLVAGLLVVIVLVYPYAKEFLTFEAIKSKQEVFQAYYEENSVLVLSGFFVGYIAVTALSLPGALIMTLGAGALFGVVAGTVLVSFASSIGATLAFLVSRYLLGKAIQAKYAAKLETFNEGMRKEGAFSLFALRLIPAFPFFLINILMGLTQIKTLTFYWVSQLGMFAGTIVYVNAGTQIAKIEKVKDILSLPLILSFVALAVIPFIAKKAVSHFRSRRETKPEQSPKERTDG